MLRTGFLINKHSAVFSVFLALTIVWGGCLFFVESLRVGDGWLDYLVVKSLSLHMFGNSGAGVSEWHPFFLPPFLFYLAGQFVPQGADYLLAHTIVWLSYFLFLIVPLKKRLSPMAAGLFLGLSFLFINFPAAIWLGLPEADIICYAIFYNRYLDVLWGGVFLLYFFDREKVCVFDLFLVGYLLLVAYFSKLSYLAGFGLVISCSVIFRQQYKYLWPMLLTAIVGLAYENFGHLLQNNYDLLVARSGERGVGGLFKARMFIPGLLFPGYMVLLMGYKGNAYHLWGMAGISFLVSLMHLGNHNDLGVVPFALLSMCILLRFWPEICGSLTVDWSKRKLSNTIVLASFIYIFGTGLLIPGVKCVITATGVLKDMLVKGDRIIFSEIPGFFISRSRLEKYDLSSSNLPPDVKSHVIGNELSNLIEYLRENHQKRYFLDIYPSLFPVFSAGMTALPHARAWIASYEFRDKGDAYRSQQKAYADFVVERDCQALPSIKMTCYVVSPTAKQK